jgi:hypothetical protein
MGYELSLEVIKLCMLVAFLTGALGWLVAQWVADVLHSIAEAVMKHIKPPSPAVLLVIATSLRKRAAALEIEASKQNAAIVAANDKKRGHPWIPELQR